MARGFEPWQSLVGLRVQGSMGFRVRVLHSGASVHLGNPWARVPPRNGRKSCTLRVSVSVYKTLAVTSIHMYT